MGLLPWYWYKPMGGNDQVGFWFRAESPVPAIPPPLTIDRMLPALRGVVLQNLGLKLPAVLLPCAQQVVPTLTNIISRGFSGGFLDKDKVTERVIYVAKHFEKVDPVKVSGLCCFEEL